MPFGDSIPVLTLLATAICPYIGDQSIVATILRTWSYQYPWVYDTITRMATLVLGGEDRFRRLPLQGLNIAQTTPILDLCCGGGQTTELLAAASTAVTALDASPKAIERAKQRVPQVTYVEAFAECLPFADQTFELVHTSMALHEMSPMSLEQIFAEVYRVLKPGGTFALIDFHQPTWPIMWPGLALFLALFETETAWQLVERGLCDRIQATGFSIATQRLYSGGTIQVIQATKP